MTSPPDDTTTDTSAIIAALRTERDAAVAREAALAGELAAHAAALAQRNSEYGERIEQQAATIDVLKAMSASAGDEQPVLDLVTRRARELCDAETVGIFSFDGDMISVRCVDALDPQSLEAYLKTFPRAPARDYSIGRAILDRRIIEIDDADADPNLAAVVHEHRNRSIITLPFVVDDRVAGGMSIAVRKPGGLTDPQKALARTLAEQVSIAMGAAETYRALQTRTSDLQESLEYQTATSDLLKVISRSTFDLQPVLATVAETAAKLCLADHAMIIRREGDRLRLTVNFGFPPEYEAHFRKVVTFPFSPGAPEAVHRAIAERRAVHIHDVAAVPGYADVSIRLGKQRTSLGVPLLREGEPIGVIILARQRVEPFTDRQIDLVSTFADQAVIAMENARLLTEQREALEQQTATAEVLQVINASPGNLTPVFDTMLDNAMHLCGAAFGELVTFDGEHFKHVAVRGVPAAYAEYRRTNPRPPGVPGSIPVRLREGEDCIHVSDLMADEIYRSGNPSRRAMVDLGGARTLCSVALRKNDTLLGYFTIYRQEIRPFSDKQIALLKNFAAQAVIAMENARLINEQREALEQQTATAEVLQVINASPGNLTPVFEAILEKAHDLCDIAHGDLQLYDGEFLHSVAQRGLSAEFADRLRQGYRASDSPASRPLLAGDRFTHITDAAAVDFMVFRSSVRPDGIRTVLFVPLRKDGSLLGMIASARREVRPFTEKEIALLENFAAQAVIAMENARLLTELRQRTEELARRNSEYGERIEQQSATIDVLEAMSASSGDAQPVFQVIVERARAFCDADHANLALVDGDMLHVQATTIENALAQFPRRVDATSMFGRAILARDAVQTPDVWADPQHFLRTMPGGAMPRPRGFVAVPLLRAGAPVGAIVLARNTPGEFPATQVELLRTFAEQAVIAISSAETFKELQRRTADLTRSVAELQALEEVLRAVNSSLELETVLSTIISRAVQLSDADEGTIYEYDVSEQVFVPKSAFGMSAERVAALRERRIKLGQTHLGRSAILRAPVYVEDVQKDPSVPNAGDVLPGIHAVLAVPLLRNDTVIGGLVSRRRTEKGFAETIITLMETFSGQAVLAIENARLFQEAGRARTAAEAALVDLRRAQDRLVQSEKMASLGQLTAGIAHEIKNPLNFVNNFSALSTELIDELRDVLAPEPLGETARTEVDGLTALLKGNLEKVVQHGQRADGIVRSMLDHSRGSSGERRMVDLNALIDEALNLAYHGARAQDQSFNITLERDFGARITPIEVNPQDITRVFLNLFANGFYAVTRRAGDGGDVGFVPTLKVTTSDAGEAVEIRVRDNGTGIPDDIRDKLFQPFFTTKPTGEGTGLGLSITYDIVTQQHGGSIAVDSKVGEYSEFTVRLPRYRP